MYHNPPYPPEDTEDEEYPPQYYQQQRYRQYQQARVDTDGKSFPFKYWLWAIGGLLVLWWLFGKHGDKPLPDIPVHADRTEVHSHVSRQVENTVPLVYTNRDGELKRVLADVDAYSEFVRVHTDNLEQARKRLHQQTRQHLAQRLDEVFVPMQNRIDRFADWYFAYATSYVLLWEATTSAGRHLGADYALKDAVSQDLEHYLQDRYQSIVLKPEVTDPQLQRAYSQSLENAHQAYLNILSVMQAEFQVFVAKHTTHVERFSNETPQLALDWQAQFNKVGMADYAKGSLGALRGITLATIGGIAGKMLGREAGVLLFPKLVAPFANKAIVATTSGVSSGGIGTLGGPVGTVVGAAAGIGTGLAIDALINEGIEFANRDEFVADTRAALATTRTEWEEALHQSLVQAVDVWFTDTVQLLPKYQE